MAKVERCPTPSRRLTDDEAVEAFNDILELRRQVEAKRSINHYTLKRLNSTYREIVLDVLAPIWRHTEIIVSTEEFLNFDLNQKRAYIADLNYLGIPMLPLHVGHLVMYAFQSAIVGVEPPLFRRTFKSRGRNPELTARAKLGILKWIYWRIGHRSNEDPWKEAARAVNRTAKTVKAWEAALTARFGAHVANELKSAREVGRAQVDGTNYLDLRPAISDHHSYIQEGWAFECDLPKLAKELKKTSGKRIVPKA